jgi:hypothetical protein
MRRDPIIDEVRAIREDIAREHDYDLNSIFRMLRRNESSEGHVNLSPKWLHVREESSKTVKAAQHHVAADKRRRMGSRTSN